MHSWNQLELCVHSIALLHLIILLSISSPRSTVHTAATRDLNLTSLWSLSASITDLQYKTILVHNTMYMIGEEGVKTSRQDNNTLYRFWMNTVLLHYSGIFLIYILLCLQFKLAITYNSIISKNEIELSSLLTNLMRRRDSVTLSSSWVFFNPRDIT